MTESTARVRTETGREVTQKSQTGQRGGDHKDELTEADLEFICKRM